jgi:hypothetical protein
MGGDSPAPQLRCRSRRHQNASEHHVDTLEARRSILHRLSHVELSRSALVERTGNLNWQIIGTALLGFNTARNLAACRKVGGSGGDLSVYLFFEWTLEI